LKRSVLVGIVLVLLVGGAVVLLNSPDQEVPEPKYPKVTLYHGLDEVGDDSVLMPPLSLVRNLRRFHYPQLGDFMGGNIDLHVSEIELDISTAELASPLKK
jgi:hypothetical protein